jgi:hypothetical protein
VGSKDSGVARLWVACHRAWTDLLLRFHTPGRCCVILFGGIRRFVSMVSFAWTINPLRLGHSLYTVNFARKYYKILGTHNINKCGLYTICPKPMTDFFERGNVNG